ncbi:uncharacterized protein LOC131891346 isoform X1 [Tigriopus californicus]|nr:uncharacterized protein LOC131891346 isoform X1 [Tigriopus californicus]
MPSRLNVRAMLPLCLESQLFSDCMGLKCNSSTSICKMIKTSPTDPVNCLINPVTTEDKLYLEKELVKEQPELALIDIDNGKIVSASFKEIPPIIIPPATSGALQAQWGLDILSCSKTTTNCQYWSKDTNQWQTFPSLDSIHNRGRMSVIGDTPVVIGGHLAQPKDEHGIVEIFNRSAQEWISVTSVTPPRRAHTLVVLNDSMLMVIGGFSEEVGFLNSVKIFDLEEQTWNDMDDLPSPRSGMACGLVNLTYVLCIGGEASGDLFNTAYGLDLALSEPKWERKQSFDLDEPIAMGNIYQLRDHLFCMTFFTTSYNASPKLRRMKLNAGTMEWDILDVISKSSVGQPLLYELKGFQIQP